jgi:lauroyl/myristoyl acyltransferase
MSLDLVTTTARRLVKLGPDAFFGPDTDAFIDEVARAHPAGDLYQQLTAESIAQRLSDLPADEVASRIYKNFIWTHFVCKLVITAAPAAALEFAQTHLNMAELLHTLDEGGPAIISGFHLTGYPLIAMGLAMSPAATLISKARVDVVESRSENLDRHLVHLSDRSAAIRITRALREGQSVWLLLDVVLPSVRVVPTKFLGHQMNVSAGLGKIAELSGRQCIPMFWEFQDQTAVVRTGDPIASTPKREEKLVQDFVDTQASFVSRHPDQWTEWYSVLADAPRLRAIVDSGDEMIWSRIAPALG